MPSYLKLLQESQAALTSSRARNGKYINMIVACVDALEQSRSFLKVLEERGDGGAAVMVKVIDEALDNDGTVVLKI